MSKADELTQRLGLAYPVYQAGMGGIAGPELAAAVSNAGGLGHLGGIRLPAEQLREWIRQTRTLTDRPFGVNLIPAGGGPDGFDALLQVVLEEKPAVLSLFFDDFAEVIPRAKAAGLLVMVQIGNREEAEKAAADGADVIIAQGVEAGGHIRDTVPLKTLLAGVIQSVAPLPVLAAGGIADAADVRAVMTMGASGVWVGTRFIATPESLAHDTYRRRLIEGRSAQALYGRDFSFGWPVGTPYRTLRDSSVWNPLRNFNGGARRTDPDDYAERISVYCGLGVDKITETLPAAEVVARLAAGIDSN